MLKKSKSEYFIKRLFTYLDERIKLEIIKYNNNIQKILCINLTDYKFFSKKYSIFEKNGKMKEYSKFSDILIYEGEYLNGKRNGKGKEYYYFNGLLKYEGEYLNGKRNGKGKEYDTCGNLVFAGEYINGNEWNGTLYDKVNNIGYSVKNGKGFIKIYYDLDKLFFEGECLKGRMNRKVKEYYDDGKLSFEGEYRNGRPWNGKGYDKNKNLL